MSGKVRKFGPRLTVSLTGNDYDALAILADKDDVSVSWVVRRAIREYLDIHRRGAGSVLPSRIQKKGERVALRTEDSQN
ncbi:MAG: CopG family transcriptional regulator [Alcanivorax sp.]|jgi:hypothetical protein|nr:CopG family transcriptional regulator [Alcanivorax sp.]